MTGCARHPRSSRWRSRFPAPNTWRSIRDISPASRLRAWCRRRSMASCPRTGTDTLGTHCRSGAVQAGPDHPGRRRHRDPAVPSAAAQSGAGVHAGRRGGGSVRPRHAGRPTAAARRHHAEPAGIHRADRRTRHQHDDVHDRSGVVAGTAARDASPGVRLRAAAIRAVRRGDRRDRLCSRRAACARRCHRRRRCRCRPPPSSCRCCRTRSVSAARSAAPRLPVLLFQDIAAVPVLFVISVAGVGATISGPLHLVDRPGGGRRARPYRRRPAGAAPAVPQCRAHRQPGTVRRRLPAGDPRHRTWRPRWSACRWNLAR